MKYSEAEKQIEVWKIHPEFDFIKVSTLGRVRTLDRTVSNGKGTYVVKGRILKQWHNSSGYLLVAFKEYGKQVDRRVHRLVAEAFIPNPNSLPEINHKDNNPANNNVSNLEWCTHEYNVAYREKYGTSAKEAALKSPVYAVSLKTQETLWFESQMEAGRSLGIAKQNISAVLKGKRKTTGGYWFVKEIEELKQRDDIPLDWKKVKLEDAD